MMGLMSSQKEAPGTLSLSLSPPHENTLRRWPSASQEDSPHQNPTMLVPDLRLLAPEL